MIIDDSAVVRGLFTRWVGEQTDIELAGSAPDGAQGVARLAALDPDVVVLDIEMPVMGGLEALPKLLALKPDLRIVMASTLSQKGAEVTLRALSLGAADYIGKPDSTRLGGADAYRDELMGKIRALAPRRSAPATPRPVMVAAAEAAPTPAGGLRPMPSAPRRAEILAIGSSTGGPQALREFFTLLDGDWTAPIVVVQHMPPTFTTLLAEQLGRVSPLPAVEAEHGMPLLPGRIHLARGDHHMTVRRTGTQLSLALDQNAAENFCRPAADPLFRSVAQLFGDRALAVVLTGMGSDGREGGRALVDAGGVMLAQDEASSVVWGMPGAVVGAGLASMAQPVPALVKAVRALGRGERP
jgi:two-component system chemotaxis response regulator CheB